MGLARSRRECGIDNGGGGTAAALRTGRPRWAARCRARTPRARKSPNVRGIGPGSSGRRLPAPTSGSRPSRSSKSGCAKSGGSATCTESIPEATVQRHARRASARVPASPPRSSLSGRLSCSWGYRSAARHERVGEEPWAAAGHRPSDFAPGVRNNACGIPGKSAANFEIGRPDAPPSPPWSTSRARRPMHRRIVRLDGDAWRLDSNSGREIPRPHADSARPRRAVELYGQEGLETTRGSKSGDPSRIARFNRLHDARIPMGRPRDSAIQPCARSVALVPCRLDRRRRGSIRLTDRSGSRSERAASRGGDSQPDLPRRGARYGDSRRARRSNYGVKPPHRCG
jgi:hypothetical protein